MTISTMDISPATIDQANKLLAWITERSEPDYDGVMIRTLSTEEYEWNRATLARRLEDRGLAKAHGAVAAGTGFVKEQAGLSGADSQAAIRILKLTGRLHQCGRGRGKALVVLRTEPVSPEEFSVDMGEGVAPATSIPANNEILSFETVSSLLSQIRTSYKQMYAEYTQVLARNATLEADNAELRRSSVFQD